MISIVMPARNEGLVIERTLSTIMSGSYPNELDLVVVCNGCTDNTVEVVRRFEPRVRVIETAIASKTNALNLGDQNARMFPRIYIDADVVIRIDAIRALASFLTRGEYLAAAPTSDIAVAGCSRPVRMYFEIRRHLPSSREGFGGSGVYALSEAGRRRFIEFPNVTADDLYVRLQFKPEERKTLAAINSTVFAPRTIKQLIAIRTRAHYGTFELAYLYPEMWVNKGESNRKALLSLFANPRLWLGLIFYGFVNAVARRNAKARSRRGKSFIWEQDNTSRGGL